MSRAWTLFDSLSHTCMCPKRTSGIKLGIRFKSNCCSLPKAFVNLLFAILSEPEQGPPSLRLLCFLALRELLPSRFDHCFSCSLRRAVKIETFTAPVERAQLPLLFGLLLAQVLFVMLFLL
jgi:hypothetical protein